ncbi:Arabinose efflux permease [Nocardioides sp. J9]|nr:Arabinose efflux permease [Nocardioides sp. J9]
MVNAFSLLSATLLVLAGNLSDRLGARRVFLGGLLAFAVTSAACGVAWSAVVLDVARATQGAAAAAVIASAFALVAETFPPHERGRALGTYGSFAALSFVVGPLAGGVLADSFG